MLQTMASIITIAVALDRSQLATTPTRCQNAQVNSDPLEEYQAIKLHLFAVN